MALKGLVRAVIGTSSNSGTMPVLLLSPHSCGTSYLIMVLCLYTNTAVSPLSCGTGYLIVVLSISMQILYISTIFLSI